MAYFDGTCLDCAHCPNGVDTVDEGDDMCSPDCHPGLLCVSKRDV